MASSSATILLTLPRLRTPHFTQNSHHRQPPIPCTAHFRSCRLLPTSPLKPRRHHHHNRTRPTTTTRCLFTGLVEEVGEIRQLGPSQDSGFHIQIAAKTVLGGANLGDSIAVNGACLTVTHLDHDASLFTVGLSPETLRKTSLGELGVGSAVNLERALLPDSRMGGHFVQGHVDGAGEIVSMVPEGDSLWVKVRVVAPPDLLRLIVPKGYIAVDGTSLTVVGVYDDEGCFDFMLVAYTQQKVVIPTKKVGDKVNLEVDILGKYVDRLLKCRLDGAGELLSFAPPLSS